MVTTRTIPPWAPSSHLKHLVPCPLGDDSSAAVVVGALKLHKEELLCRLIFQIPDDLNVDVIEPYTCVGGQKVPSCIFDPPRSTAVF